MPAVGPSRHPATARAALAAASVALVAAGTGALAASDRAVDEPRTSAQTVPFDLVEDRDVDDRLPRPEDRYAVARGCYTVEADGGFISRSNDGLTLTDDAADALPLHFQPTRLGEYLLATDEGRDTRYEGAWWDVRHYLAGGQAVLPGDDVVVAEEPSSDAEWRLVATGDDPDRKSPGQTYELSLAERAGVLTVHDGELRIIDDADAAAPLRLRHVTSEDCAVWPEIETGASGEPEPVKGNPNGPVQGFFEAHIHGMAFEFLGGELRCGAPWHEYGVEYALGNCYEEKNYFNGVLEVPIGGQPATDPVAEYDPVGWPTFNYWPQPRTLTHEQFYWRWLERAHRGGLRLLTNLLVENAALCQDFPVKKNSCNEMDSVRLQAQRINELQNYIDAQNGGPGEGWFRIVTSPAQARQAINDGRLAVVLGIENSALFDCNEFLDQPLCTADDIDERLQEVFDMGVRQMQMINKFDNALAGVTGDNGSTGLVVNSGNRQITGHYWDMRTCGEEGTEHADTHDHIEGEEHDKTQLSPADPVRGRNEGIDALAGRVLNEFGKATKGFVSPAYAPGPHCNARGLTELGAHLLKGMVDKHMIFDPDHMSALAQHQALDLIENEIIPAEQKAAAEEGRAPVQPALISSHSWGNDVVYQRIYELDGVVAPRTQDAAGFVASWLEHRGFAQDAPDDYLFGMGYGADTNGFGGQPQPRKDAALEVDYSKPFEAPIGGVTLTQQKSGLRNFDINEEGVSHYGMFADWFHELTLAQQELGAEVPEGLDIIEDMLNGVETYIAMWERMVYGTNDCVTDGSTLQFDDLHAALGLNLEGFLTAIGQPVDREGAAYVYCVEGEDGGSDQVEVVFDDDGTAADVRDRPDRAPAAEPAPAAEAPSGTTSAAAPSATTATTPDAPAAPAAEQGGGAADEPAERAAADDAAPADDDESIVARLAGSPVGIAVGALALLVAGLLGTQAVVRRHTEA
jgi:microsomal dipeptidase-like Zn-dependent dipeptidase